MSAVPNGVVAFVFPGVGVLLREGETGFFRRHRPRMAPFLDEASDLAGCDLVGALESGAVADLDERVRELFTQAFNCAAAAVFRERGLEPVCMAGHSLGIYSALAAAGAVSFPDSLRMVARARTLVRQSCPEGSFGMGVVIGLSGVEMMALLRESGSGSLAVAAVNSDVSMVVSGDRAQVEMFLARAEARGAVKSRLLNIDMPYHHPGFLAGTREAFAAFLRGLTWSAPACPIISSLDQAVLADPAGLIDFTARNLSTPIRWREVIDALAAQGVRTVIECGPGISLTQNAHFIEGAPMHVNVRTARWRMGI